MTTPRTKAGRALVARYLYDKSEPDYISILAIEAEARADALRALHAGDAAEAAPLDVESDEWCIATCPLDSEPHRHLTAKGSRT
jgi:hypothetical protein